MKKIIIFSILFISTYCYSVDLDNAYRNAKLNVDFSSSIVFNDKEIVKEKELGLWILSNSDKFENINQIKVAIENKWYWGSWKRVVKAVEFVKKENIQNRLAYFEELRKINEKNRPLSLEEKLHQFNEFLKIPEVQSAGKYIGKKVKEGVESFKESWKNASSESSSSSSSSNDNVEEKDSEDKKTLENKSDDKVHIEFRETDQVGECNNHVDKPKIRYFNAVNKNNGQSKGTFKIIVCDGKYWSDCPDSFSAGNSNPNSTLKEYLIKQYEGQYIFFSSPNSYTIIEK